MEVEFNLQRFLSEMREEQQRGFSAITMRMDKVADDLSTHENEDVRTAAALEKRLGPLEELRSDIRWLAGGCISAGGLAAFGFLADFFKNHWGR